MNRPEIKALTITNPINTKGTITITVTAEDVVIIFESDINYARASGYEVYAGEGKELI